MHHTNKAYQWVPSLYFVQGLPFALATIVATILYKELNINNATISLYISIFNLPWILKPLWTPYLEIIATKRKWLLVMQYMIAISILLLVLVLYSSYFLFYSFILFSSIAFFSATYDAASDGFYFLNLNATQQAYYVGIRTLFYQIARLFCSGILIMLIGTCQHYYTITTSWQLGLVSMALVLILFALYHAKILPHIESSQTKKQQAYSKTIHIFFDVFRTFFTLPHIKTFVVFLLLYNAAEAQLLRIVPLFLLDKTISGGLDFSITQTGFIYGLCGSFAVTIGAIIAGWFIGATTLKRSLILITFIATIANSSYFFLSYLHINNLWLASGIIIAGQFCFGLATSAYMVFLMKMCNSEKYKTTFYAIGTALMALGVMLFGIFSGFLQQTLTYNGFFLWIIALSSVILLYTIYVAKKIIP